MHRDPALWGLLAAVSIYAAVRARRASAGVGTPTPDAVGWYGTMSLHQQLALFFGKQALYAEAQYWKAVRA